MGRLVLIVPSITSLARIGSCLITAHNRKPAKFDMKFGALTIYIFCNLLWSASCLQRGCEQDQGAGDGIFLSPEGLCSVDVPQLRSRNSRDNLETRGSVRATDEQEAGLRERFNSKYLENETSSRLEEGICSGKISDPLNSCGVALFQGRRPSQEDRAICLPQLCLSVSESRNITVGLYAVFDGHGGQEASTFAAEAFHQHFANHFTQIMGTSEIASTTGRKTLVRNGSWVSQGMRFQQSPFQAEGSSAALEHSIMPDDQDRGRWHSVTPLGARRFKGDTSIKTSNVDSFKDRPKRSYSGPAENSAKDDREQAGHHPEDKRRHYTREVLEYGVTIRQVLEEALSRSIYSIDAMFSVEATQRGLSSGTTACIVLQVEEDLLVANLGDSKAFFCEPSEEVTCYPKVSRRRRKKLKGDCKARLRARELTRDHRPDRHDERQRIEGAGGFVTAYGGVARVNGKLAVSRSVGDVYFKRYGVVADPEFTGWLKVPRGQSFLTVASDGIFEKLSTQSVCEVLQAINQKEDVFAVLGLEDSRVNAPIAMLPTGDGFGDQGKLLTRSGSARIASGNICAPENELGNFSSAVVNSLKEKEDEHKEALCTEESPLVEGLSLVQSMAQVVGETALELGTMDNVATIVLSLGPLPPLLPDPNPLFDKTMDNSPRFIDDQENDIKRSKENTLWGLPDKAPLVTPVPDADSVPLEGSTWSKSLNQNKSSAVMVHNRETSYCYELIETLPRHAIVPLTNIMEGETFHKEDETVYRGAFLATDVPYGCAGKDPVGAGASLEVYREHLVCTPKKHTYDKETKELCRRPDGLLHFLALIGSVPLDSQTLLPETDVFAGLPDRPVFVPSSVRYHRYMLKKNFARGAFGEVWLAVRRTRSVPAGSHVNGFSNGSCSQEETKAQSQTPEQKRSVKHDKTTYVLKRILVERGNHVYLSGLREKYFGEIFLNASRARARAAKYSASFSCAAPNPFSSSIFGFCPWGFSNSRKLGGQNSGSRGKETLRGSGRSDFGPSISEEGVEHIVRYVESFEVIEPRELWLVFKNEGKSLSNLLYSSERAEVEPDLDGGDGYFTVVQPSPWWHWLKTTSEGRKEMRSLLRQLLLAVRACHARNITHRDIKPENMIVSWRGSRPAGTPKADYPSKLKMRLIDFGSALDPFTVKHMYGPSGPSRLEQTNEYAPPEALLGKHWLHFHSHQAHVYDIWSVGVVMLELVLGTPHVFQISSRTRALLDRRLQGWDQSDKETAYMLRAFLEMCILLPGIPLQHQFHHNRDTVDHSEEQRLASWECTEQAFQEQIKQRDVLGIGMPDKWALRLVRRLLQWYPEDRISAVDALKHPYFHPKLKVD